MLNEIQIKRLISSWNSYFGIDNTEVTYTVDNLTSENLFNEYLKRYRSTLDFEYQDLVCYCEKNNSKIDLLYLKNNEVYSEHLDIRAKRKFYNIIGNFKYIITNNFPISIESIDRNKILLRYELVRNIFTSNHTHFFSKSLPFPIGDNSIFLTNNFLSDLLSNENRLNRLRFSSYLLNQFEIGVAIDDLILKPNIMISPYGRWYWSGTEKIQNDMKSRNRVYNKLLKHGKVINLDLISGEPIILSGLSNSSLLKKLVKYRISIRNHDSNLSTSIKNLINIFIHAAVSPNDAVNKFKSTNDYKLVESKLGIPIIDIFSCLHEDFLWYNKKVNDNYLQNLSCSELSRRIVNPVACISTYNEINKEHRKFLQGHTHDKILDIAMNVYNDCQLIPMFTVHDSLTYFVHEREDIKHIKEIIKSAVQKTNSPVTIQILDKNK